VAQAWVRERANEEAPLGIDAPLIVQEVGFQNTFYLLNVHLDTPRVDHIVEAAQPSKGAICMELDKVVGVQGVTSRER
jgi:hypothetical protein